VFGSVGQIVVSAEQNQLTTKDTKGTKMENQKYLIKDEVLWKVHKGRVVGYNEKHPELVQVLFQFGLRQLRENDPDLRKMDQNLHEEN
jgi:hypothetical protein